MSTAERLSKLKKTRGGHRGSTKRMIAELEKELIASSSSELDLVKIMQLKKNLEGKLPVVEKLDTEIIDLLEEEEEIAEDIEKADEYKGLTYAAIIKAKKSLTGAPTKESVSASNITPESSDSEEENATLPGRSVSRNKSRASRQAISTRFSKPADSDEESSSSGSSSGDKVSPPDADYLLVSEHSSRSEPTLLPSTSHAKSSVKLPKLTLRPFSGDLTQWFTFWDSFKAAVHNNSQLVGIDKFNYLKSLLSGAALETIQGLALTDANYKEAVAILQRRFGNRQQIIDKHMNQLLKVEPVASPRNVVGLRRLFDSIESHIRSLSSLGVQAESYSSLLSSVLLDKLPEDIQLLISRKVPEKNWGLTSLMEVFQEELQARERICSDITNKSTRNGRSASIPTGATLFSGVSRGVSCYYCDQAHLSKDCKVVTQAEARRQLLKKAGRCFVCLRTGHIKKECRSKTKCSKCGRRHHISICLGEKDEASKATSEGVQQGTSQNTQSTSSETSGSKLNVNAPPFPPKQKTTSLYVSSNKTVLLQTAVTTICNPNQPTVNQRVRAVLDLGSQRSYISQRAAKSLGLQPEEVHKMAVFTFGSTERTIQNCELVRITLRTLDGGEIEMTLLTSPTICEPLTDQPLSLCLDAYEHLTNLQLADNSGDGSPIEVDLLLGANYYWQLTTGEVRRGDDGPVAVGTKLGWVLSGPAPMADHSLLTTTHTLRVASHEEESLNDTLRSFWELESLGISESCPSVHQEFEENISFKDGRYEVCLQWKGEHPLLPDNYGLSLKRLQGLLRRLRQTPDILQEYDSVIRKQLEQGIVQPAHYLGVVGEVHYLPHHAVIKQNRETTKVRVVYDASARSGGPSLNSCLHTGPSFNQKILDIMLRFRSLPSGNHSRY